VIISHCANLTTHSSCINSISSATHVFSVSLSLSLQIIDFCIKFLFGWEMNNLDPKHKPVNYCHLYSYSSVKGVVHWFQIIRKNRFQMYEPAGVTYDRGQVSPCYPLARITCPIVLFYGGRDTLPDIDFLTRTLPSTTVVHHEPSYEHMDFLYAPTAKKCCYEKIVETCRAVSTKARKKSVLNQ